MIDKSQLERLTKDIKSIARAFKIPKAKLILDEIPLFLEEHQHHGYAQVRLFYYGEALDSIGLHCDAQELDHKRICRHHDPEIDYGVPYSIIYSKAKTQEVEDQRRRREYILERDRLLAQLQDLE